jgi:hypothetical protein
MTSDSASRVTRSRRDLRLAVVLFLAGLAAVTALRAQEPAKPSAAAARPAAAPSAATPAGEATTQTPGPAAATRGDTTQPADDKAAPPPAGASDHKPGTSDASSTHFEPTEKVRADFDVSFPVDI